MQVRAPVDPPKRQGVAGDGGMQVHAARLDPTQVVVANEDRPTATHPVTGHSGDKVADGIGTKPNQHKPQSGGRPMKGAS